MSTKINTIEELAELIKQLDKHHHIMWAIKTTVSERYSKIMYSGTREEFDNISKICGSLRIKLYETYKPNVKLVNSYSFTSINQLRQKFNYFKNRFISKYDGKK